MFDAIVIGSGMSGGIAAKELCERGLKVLVIERGPRVEHDAVSDDGRMPWELPGSDSIPEDELARDYPVQRQCFALNQATRKFWVKDSEHRYTTPAGRPFAWIRGYQLGGRSIIWGRQCFRLSPHDLEANARDGHGCDWPIRYDDLAPWYAHVERFIRVAGSREGLAQLPDGEFIAPPALDVCEQRFKTTIETRFPGRKVIIGRSARYSSLTGAMPAAERTGNLTVVTDAIVHSLVQDPRSGKITQVKVIDAVSRAGRTFEGRVVFLNASAIASAQILLNSASEANPHGLCNRSDQVGRNLMDHLCALSTVGMMPHYPHGGDDDGLRANVLYIPRFRNLTEAGDGYLRGYGFQCGVMPARRPEPVAPGAGQKITAGGRRFGAWLTYVSGFGEMLPDPNNRVTLHATRTDKWGIPLVHIDCAMGQNETRMARQILADGKAMFEAAGGVVIGQAAEPAPPGLGIHEMGTARMGRDPMTSVFNGFSQAHEAPNLFCTDGAVMASGGCQNPALTFMALAARGADVAACMLREGRL